MIRVRVTGQAQVQQKLAAELKALQSLQPALDKLGKEVVAQIQRNIDAGQKGTGGKFAPLSPKYAAAKKAKYGSRPILEASGAMRDSIKAKTYGNGVAVTADGNDSSGVSNADKLKWHRKGTATMAARDPVTLPRGYATEQMKKAVNEHRKKIRGK